MRCHGVCGNIPFLSSQESAVSSKLLFIFQTFYTPSLETEETFLKCYETVEKGAMSWRLCYRCIMKQMCWCNFFRKSRSQRYGRFSKMSWVSNRKKHVICFSAHWDNISCCLDTSHIRGKQKSPKAMEGMEAKVYLLLEWTDETWDFSHWRCTSVFQICRAGLESLVLFHNIPASTSVLSFFSHVIEIDVLHEYMGYTTVVVETLKCELSHIDGKVLSLARLVAVISAVTYCFCDEGAGKVSCHCQKLLSTTYSFSSLLLLAKWLRPLRCFCINEVQKSLMFRLMINKTVTLLCCFRLIAKQQWKFFFVFNAMSSLCFCQVARSVRNYRKEHQ